MECDVAVLGGGPGGYTAAIRAAQLGAKVACIEKEPELGGTCLRVGCIPTKAWVQTAFALKEAEETLREARRQASASRQLDFARRERVEGRRRQADDAAASRRLFKANGVEWVKGTGRFKDANTIAVEGGEDVTFKSAIVATGLVPAAAADRRASTRRAASTRPGCSRRRRCRERLVVLGGGIIGCEFASIFSRFGSEVTIIEMLADADPAGGRRRGEGAREAVRQARHRAPPREAVHEGRGRRRRAHRPLRRRRDRRGRPDARRRSAAARSSRASGSRRSASSSTSARASPPTSTAGRPCRTSTRSATAPATGSSRTPRSARARSPPRTRAATTRSSTTAPCRARSTPIRRSRASA